MPLKPAWPAQRRVLVVDDEKFIRRLIIDVLTDLGCRIDAAENGEAAWNLLQSVKTDADQYHLLITDNLMPKLSGIALINKVRAEGMTLPIILASGTPPSKAEAVQLADALRPVVILPKPFSIADLSQKVNALLI